MTIQVIRVHEYTDIENNCMDTKGEEWWGDEL